LSAAESFVVVCLPKGGEKFVPPCDVLIEEKDGVVFSSPPGKVLIFLFTEALGLVGAFLEFGCSRGFEDACSMAWVRRRRRRRRDWRPNVHGEFDSAAADVKGDKKGGRVR
jgi:hypothetical protein